MQEAYDTAALYLRQGRLDEAEALCASILQQHPADAAGLALRGQLALQRGRPEQALADLDQALSLRSDLLRAHVARGNALQQLGRNEDAVQAYAAAIALDPRAYDAHANRGVSWSRLGRDEQALLDYNAALALQPDTVDIRYNRGLLLFRGQRHSEALDDFDAVLSHHAKDAEAWSWRAYSLCALHRHAEAMQAANEACRLAPASASAWRAIAYVRMQLGQEREAIQAYRSAIAVRRADDPEAGSDHHHLGLALTRAGMHEAALAEFEQASNCNPAAPHAAGDRLIAAMRTVHWEDFAERRADLCAAIARGESVASPFAVATFADDPALISRAGALFLEQQGLQRLAPAPLPALQPRERIRIGYFSADFHAHATALLMIDLLSQHDRAQFEVFLFAFGPTPPDAMTAQLADAVEHFIDVRTLPDEAICALAQQSGIDIAIDLKGYTQDCRPGIFARRAAPLQLNYLGYPGGMGAGFIDYLIGDPVVTPLEQQAHYCERLACLPHCYQPNSASQRSLPPPVADRAAARQAAGLPAQGFVFCCFNNTYKITPDWFALWMDLLREVDDSVLWLYEPDAEALPRLRMQAEAHGIAASRLIFAPKLALPEHLARHELADLFLDTLPYNAHTTGSDALWAGLPMLSCLGAAFPGRVGASLLHAVGLPELIASSPEDYRARALRWACDPVALRGLRERLQGNRANAPLFDTARYRRHLEAAYRQMWQRCLRGEAPVAFVVPATPD